MMGGTSATTLEHDTPIREDPLHTLALLLGARDVPKWGAPASPEQLQVRLPEPVPGQVEAVSCHAQHMTIERRHAPQLVSDSFVRLVASPDPGTSLLLSRFWV